MIRICDNCSSVIIDKVKEIAGADNVQVGCIGRCGTPYVCLVDTEELSCDSEEEFYEALKAKVK